MSRRYPYYKIYSEYGLMAAGRDVAALLSPYYLGLQQDFEYDPDQAAWHLLSDRCPFLWWYSDGRDFDISWLFVLRF
jgi:hypothetical protein